LKLEWQWKTYKDLSQRELYEVLKARQTVFVVEQDCIYQDIDGLDHHAWHLLAMSPLETGPPVLAAYLRIIQPGYKYKEAAMGRVLVAKPFRGTGLGNNLVKKGIEHLRSELTQTPIKISAQQYLVAFYEALGFVSCSAPYDEDGILHIEMTLNEPNEQNKY